MSILNTNIERIDFWQELVDNLYNNAALVDIHTKLKRPIIPEQQIFMEILDAYKAVNHVRIAIQLILNSKEAGIYVNEFELYLAKLYLELDKYKNALNIVQKILKTDEQNNDALVLLGEINFLQKKYPKAISAYKKLDEENLNRELVVSRLVQCYAAEANIAKAKKILDERFKNGIQKRSFHTIYLWANSEQFSIDILAECINDKTVLARQKNELWREFDYFFKQIFDDSINITQNGELRVGLLRLHHLISTLKRKLQLTATTDPNVYHYSTTSSIVPLTRFKSERASRFQLSNVSCMNDPAEGAVLSKILESFCEPGHIRSIMKKLYGNESYLYRKTYLSSFSLRRDFLPMWVQYANKGSGCCYKIASSQFGWNDYSLESQVIQVKNYKWASKSKRPVLYKVFYYDNEQDGEILALCKRIAESLLLIEKFFSCERVADITAGMLDEIRYLFKSKDYRTEEEVRVIMTDHNHEALTRSPNSDELPPKIDLEMPMDLYFEELMLGPRVPNIKVWAAYLGNCSNVKQVAVSEIQFQ